MQQTTTAMTTAPMRTVRPLMLRDVYADPEKELVRLRRTGRARRIAPGTYVATPDTVAPGAWWTPGLEEAAMAYATAAYRDRVPVLVGLGAARWWRAIPRAIGVTTVAVPAQHRRVELTIGGTIVFTTRHVERIDAVPATGELGTFLVATIEQTAIDLVLRPDLGGMPAAAAAAVPALVDRADPDRLGRLVDRLPRARRDRVRDAVSINIPVAMSRCD